MIQQRQKRNSSKVNLIISFTVHGLLVLVVFFFAAREGMLGKKLKQLAVTMVKEKKPEPPKPKPEEPKPEPPKTTEAPKAGAPAAGSRDHHRSAAGGRRAIRRACGRGDFEL